MNLMPQSAGPTQRQPAPRVVDIIELRKIALELRKIVVRLVGQTGQGYLQQGLGAADLFTALYFAEMRLDPSDPLWMDRDRFLLSTAHNTAIFHATLALRGFIPLQSLDSYCTDGSTLEINASERLGPMIEATCGSLGQGLSVGIGMALAARRQSRPSRIYVLLGDGEMQEGQVWEAAMSASSLRLDNLCLVIDNNKMQVEGHTDSVMQMESISDKWKSFGFFVETINGHDLITILQSLDRARNQVGKPSCIIANTIPGKGASSIEGIFGHNMRLPKDLERTVLQELDAEYLT
ncbi:MAG: transketolase [Anaerolineaceae bacterium]|nr:transketolase [Formivibrio sp.]MDR3576420.1 transketolase [Anaerolineaceae bacterium]